MNTRMIRNAAAASAALMFLAGCASSPPAPIERKTVKQVEATVVAIHSSKRLVGLRRADGQVVTVELGPEVVNFDQIKVGDRVIASYFEAISFSLLAAREATAPGAAGVVAGRAMPGERPEAALGGFIETTVTIESVDNAAHTVTFTGDDGMVRTVSVEREDGRAFASRLRPGDRVLITYAEAIAISVEPGK
jgi:hypothetical protein